MIPRQRKKETAADYLRARVPRASAQTSVGELIDSIQGHAYDAAELICICDDANRLLGAVSLARALAPQRERRLGKVMLHPVPAVHPDEDQERIASIALHHGLEAVPVVDANGCLLGIVPPAALLLILRHEHVEDIHRFASIHREDAQAQHALFEPPARRARHRLPWLLVGLAGSVVPPR